MENQDYLNGLLQNNEVVIRSIYDQFYSKVRAFVTKNSGHEADAQDTFNKALLQLTARIKLKQFEIQSTFEGYLFTACKNLWRRELNKRRHREVTKDNVRELYYEEDDLAASTLEQERMEIFKEKLLELSDNCKTILALFFKKVSGKDIMHQLDYASETTVRQRIFKCKKKLTELIQSDLRFTELKTL